MADTTPENLFTRTGLPEDLRALVARYPRETWDDGQPIGTTGRFWLDRHGMFRELGGSIADGARSLREGEVGAEAFAGWLVPRLNMFLGELEGHHNVEDHHYFPAFAAAEPKLKHGFELLDCDHHLIHDLLEENAAAGNAFLSAIRQGGDPLKRACEAYSIDIARLMSGLTRHLDDEEDIVIPMLIERGEGGFG